METNKWKLICENPHVVETVDPIGHHQASTNMVRYYRMELIDGEINANSARPAH